MLIVTTKNNQILFQLTSNVIFTNVNNEWIRHQSLISSSIRYYVIDWWWRHWWLMTSSFIFNGIACARFRCRSLIRNENTKWNISEQRWIWFSIQKSFLNLSFSIFKWGNFTFLTFLEGNQFIKISFFKIFKVQVEDDVF